MLIFKMAYRVNNSDTVNAIRNAARLSISEGFPTTIQEVITPVIECNPDLLRKTNVVRHGNATNNNITVYTTPTTEDFYLTDIVASMVKDAASDNTNASINIVIDGATRTLLIIPGLTLTATNTSIAKSYNKPIKLDRGTNISMNRVATTAGSCLFAVSICGYITPING